MTRWRHTMGTFPHAGYGDLVPLSPARSQRRHRLRQEAETRPFHARLKPPDRNLLPEGKVLPQRRELFPLKFKLLVPRLIASCSQAQAPTPSPLPLPHFRALTSGLFGVRGPLLAGHLARGTRGVKMTEVLSWGGADSKCNEGTCLRLKITRAGVLPSGSFRRKILQFVLLMYFDETVPAADLHLKQQRR